MPAATGMAVFALLWFAVPDRAPIPREGNAVYPPIPETPVLRPSHSEEEMP